MKIRTEFVYPPIPDRQFDWSAVDDDTYEPGCPIGSGRTELAAVKDLMQQLEENYAPRSELNTAYAEWFRSLEPVTKDRTMPMSSKTDDPLGHYAYRLGEAEQESRQFQEVLGQVHATLVAHGKVDRGTDLHKRIMRVLGYDAETITKLDSDDEPPLGKDLA